MLRHLAILLLLLHWPFWRLCAQIPSDPLPLRFHPVQQLIQQGQFDSVAVLLDQLPASDTTSFWAHLFRYQNARNLRRHKTAFRLARRAQHKLEALTFQQRQWLEIQSAEAAFNRRKRELALEHLDQFQKLRQQHKINDSALVIYAKFVESLSYGLYGDHRGQPAATALLGVIQRCQQYPQALPYLHGQVFRRLGNLMRISADFDGATNYYQQELQLYQIHYPADHFETAVAHYSLGNIAYELMAYQTALDHYRQTYHVWKDHFKPSATYLRYLTEAMGDMYWELNIPDSAIYFYDLAVNKSDAPSQNPLSIQMKRGDSLLVQKDYRQALNTYTDALAFRREIYGAKHAMTGACQSQIAKTHYRKGQLTTALQAYQRAITMLVVDFDDSTSMADPQPNMEVLSEQYLLEALAGKTITLRDIYRADPSSVHLQNAWQTAQRAVQMLQQLRSSPLSDPAKLFWTQKYYFLFEIAIELAYAQFPEEETFIAAALPLIESSKALLLHNQLRSEQEISFHNLSEKILEEEKQLKKNINEYSVKINREEQLCERANQRKLSTWQKELQQHKLQYRQFLQQLATQHPKYYALRHQNPTIQLADVRERLLTTDSSAVLICFESEAHLYLLAIDQQRGIRRRIAKASLLLSQLATFLSAVQNIEQIYQQPEQNFRQFTKTSYWLYQHLLADLFKQMGTATKHWYWIPDRLLYPLPMACLLTEAVSVGQKRDFRPLPYLLRQHHFTHSPSLGSLMLHQNNPPSNDQRTYTGFAPAQFPAELPSLRWNQAEVREAQALWSGEAYFGPQATKAAFLQSDYRSTIEHLATHAVLDHAQPMRSHILFEGLDSSDHLFVYELYAKALNADLVILNACQTNSGAWTIGEGMVGLEQAFRYAGCNSLLTNSWAVDDQAAAQLTQYLFEGLHAGSAKDIALSGAQERYLSTAEPAYRHPYFWAGLRLSGAPHPLPRTNQGNHNWWVLIGIALLIGALYFFIRPRSIQKS